MSWALDVFLDKHISIPKRLGGFALCGLEGVLEFALRVNDAHTLPASAVDGLDEDGVACEFEACQGGFI